MKISADKNKDLDTGITTSGTAAGTSFTGHTSLPTARKKKKEKIKPKEIYVKKRGDSWCVVHSDGGIIKSFPKKENADKMYEAIINSKIKKEKLETENINNLNPLLDQFKPITLIHNFISLVGSTIKKEKGHAPNDIDLHLRLGKDIKNYLERAVNMRLNKLVDNKFSNKLHIFSGDAEGSHDTFIPVYHLALIPAERKITEMSKNIKLLDPFLPQKPAGSAYYDLDKFIEALK